MSSNNSQSAGLRQSGFIHITLSVQFNAPQACERLAVTTNSNNHCFFINRGPQIEEVNR